MTNFDWLEIAELAEGLKCSVKSVYNYREEGIFVPGIHFYTVGKGKEASKKDWNRNVFTVRTNDDISSMIKEYCQINNISPNRFLNDLLNSYFKFG